MLSRYSRTTAIRGGIVAAVVVACVGVLLLATLGEASERRDVEVTAGASTANRLTDPAPTTTALRTTSTVTSTTTAPSTTAPTTSVATTTTAPATTVAPSTTPAPTTTAPPAPPSTAPRPPSTPPATTATQALPSGLTRVADAEAYLVGAINAERSAAGSQGLTRNGCMDGTAKNWSIRLAELGALAHSPDLLEALLGCRSLSRVAENVGYGQSIEELHTAFMNSPGHAANVLRADHTEVGVSVLRDGRTGILWVTVQFLSA